MCTRSITWAKTPIPASSSSGGGALTYRVGDIGPGGGLVFLISGGLTYEMAPNTWSGSSSDDTPTLSWCGNTFSNISGAVGTAVGTGSANTAAIAASVRCSSNAAAAVRAYTGGGLMDWFLPSKDELNAMCNYSRNPGTVPTGACTGAQDGTFAAGTYGFVSDLYWSSSQSGFVSAWYQGLDLWGQASGSKGNSLRVRPVRAF